MRFHFITLTYLYPTFGVLPSLFLTFCLFVSPLSCMHLSDTTWIIPIQLEFVSTSGTIQQTVLLEAPDSSVPIDLTDTGLSFLDDSLQFFNANAEQSGYFVVDYDEKSWASVLQGVHANYWSAVTVCGLIISVMICSGPEKQIPPLHVRRHSHSQSPCSSHSCAHVHRNNSILDQSNDYSKFSRTSSHNRLSMMMSGNLSSTQ